jgi:hypothetical protein
MVGIVGSCRQEGCRVGDGGACALDKNPLDCDWFDPVAAGGTEESADPMEAIDALVVTEEPALEQVASGANDEEPEVVDATEGDELPVPPVPSGLRNQVVFSDRSVDIRPMSALGAVHADGALAQEPTSVVLLVGPAKSGKTTLIACLLEQLQRGPIGAWSFAGSRSLLGFLRRSYLASMASGSPYATTLRTRHAEIDAPWLHLRLNDGSRGRALLLADVSGEYFRNLASGADLGDASGIASRADHLVYLVDCATYINRRTRQQALTAFRGLVRRMVEGDLCSRSAKHTILITKVDCLDESVAHSLMVELTKISSTYLGSAPILVSAARPADHSEAIGISELVDVLAEPLPPGESQSAEPNLGGVPKPLAKMANTGGELARPVDAEGGAA